MKKDNVKFNSLVETLTVTNYYDLDGELIEMDSKKYKNANVTIVEKEVEFFGEPLKEVNILVNDKVIGYNVISAKGNSKELSVCVCDDAG